MSIYKLAADQLSLTQTLTLTDNELINHTHHYSELFPRLSAFNSVHSSTVTGCSLLAVGYNPTDILVDVINFSAGSVNSFFGHFNIDASKHLSFADSSMLAEKKPIFIPAALLLQDELFTNLLIKTLNEKEFNSRWLLNGNSPTEIVAARHRSIPVKLSVVIYGYSSDLIHLNQAWPMLEILTNETLYEADLAFKPTQQNILAFVSLIQHKFAYQLDAKQALALLWAQARIAEDQHWLSLDINYLEKLFLNLPKPFDQTDVETVVKRLTGYYSHAREFNYDQIIRGAVKVEVEGEKVGQINGLTVVETPTAEFGEPSRITANVFLGDGDIGDIERKSDLGGNIHAKAMLILSSFVSRTFAQNAPMPVSSNIVFEQSYHEVDGDSASVAELYALLSALAKLPIKQNVAVTGAMDQLGNVLVVGGLDLKIEGFYSIAKTLHPDIHHAAIIPAANAEHLNLSSEIIEAVRNGDFTIYAIEHVSDAAELLTSLPAESDEEGQDSLFEKVRSSLDKFEDDVESHPPLRLKILQLLKLSRN